jgi:glutamate synthase domain-containing protein 2
VPPNACICDTCPIYYEYSLKDLYYCVKEESGHSKTPIRKRYDDESEDSYQSMVDIKDLSQGYEILTSMGSPKEMPVKLDDLHFIPGQVNKIPLNTDDKVDIKTIIGPNAKKPFKINSPIIISGMSFGAVSRNVRLIISSAASLLKMGFNSGEGGVLDEELEFKDFMILQYSTGRFGISDQLLKSAAAIEIRFGQGAYPGKGSYLPADKITAEVARVRGLKVGEAANSPARHPDIANQNQLEKKIKWLKNKSSGAPVGAKIGCGNVEADVKLLADAGVDYIALDGFGAATGATNAYVRDNVGIPIIAALPRAFKTLKKNGETGHFPHC